MADKKDKKPAPAPMSPYAIVGYALGISFAVYELITFISKYFGIDAGDGQHFFDSQFISTVKQYVFSTLIFLQVVSLFISLLFLMIIIYLRFRIQQIKRAMALAQKIKLAQKQKKTSGPSIQNQKWKNVIDKVSSSNPSDWRLAILEADIMLEDVLSEHNFNGETLGEKLKNADRTEFKTLNEAWEAHKVRNLLAHEGENFPLNQREAKRIISLFEDVFKEFGVV